MQTYRLSCRKDTGNKNAKVFRTKNGRLMLKSVCSVCGNKNSRLISNDQKDRGILSQLGIRTALSQTPLLNIFF